jgi:predicted acyl esterase
MMGVRCAVIMCGFVLLGFQAALAQPAAQSEPTREQLKKWLEEYPQADANRDGVLTREEADAYRRLREQRRGASEAVSAGFRTEFTYATMSDGVRIALAVAYPRGFDPDATARKWPALMEMHGYPDSTVPRSPGDFGDQYVTVRASLRGAGASDGTIQAISRRNGLDGHEVIENWIVKQPWSNGKVALHGHSWGGLSAFMIAATNPPHLTAVAVSGLLDDLYRDIGRIGGVRNSGFPAEWMVNLYTPTGPFQSSEAARQARGLSRQEYEEMLSSRPPWDLQQEVLWKSLTSSADQPEFAAASPGAFASGVRAPIHIMHAYQDEQTGPSGVWLWKYIPDDVPKRLVLSNGNHGDVGRFSRERLDWLNYWTLRDGQGDPREFSDRARRVQVYFETPRNARSVNPPLAAADFPLPQTQWTRYYFRAAQQLSTQPPSADESGGDVYAVAVGRSDSNIEGVHYVLAFDKPTALCGPIGVTFWATCTTVDTDFYVAVADVDANGVIQLLQRGLLRGSHGAIDQAKSLSVIVDSQEALVRPRHTHRDMSPLVPGQPYRFDVEVFPVGHVFRTGHQLAVWISQPPLGDPVTRRDDGRPAYMYESAMPPSTVRILRSDQYPSCAVLPLLPELPPLGDTALPAGEQAGIFTFVK